MLDATDPRTLDLWITLGNDGETVAEFVERLKRMPEEAIQRVAREIEEAELQGRDHSGYEWREIQRSRMIAFRPESVTEGKRQSDHEFIREHAQLIDELTSRSAEEAASTDNASSPRNQEPVDNPRERAAGAEHD